MSHVVVFMSTIGESNVSYLRYYVDLKKDVFMHYCCGACKALVSNSVTPNCATPCIDSKFIEVPLHMQVADRFKGMVITCVCVCLYTHHACLHVGVFRRFLQNLPFTQSRD